MNTQDIYQETIKFAAHKHSQQGQIITNTDLPYVVHLSNVTMEVIIASSQSPNFDLNFAIRVALLHDTLEDTATDFAELEQKFGIAVAQAVSALTKNLELPKSERMPDSIRRIKTLSAEVWAVKLADRITNLQRPPHIWDKAKRQAYLIEAQLIYGALKEGNPFLAQRLASKIAIYPNYINEL